MNFKIEADLINFKVEADYKGISYVLTRTNCHIVDGYLYSSRKLMEEFCLKVLPNDFFKARSLKSYVAEWRAHNLLYDLHLFRSHTQDTDLSTKENKFARFCYSILTLFYRGK